MSTLSDIVIFHIKPRLVIRRRISHSTGDGEALLYLLLACFAFFLAQIPEMVRLNINYGSEFPFHGMVAARFVGVAIFAPILFYIVSALTRIVLKAGGLKISWLNSRISLFWALLASTPMMLALGVVQGLTQSNIVLWSATVIVGLLFLFFWIIGIIESASENQN